MKTITEIIGGAQSLLGIQFDLQGCFEEYLTNEHKTFLHPLRVAEAYLPVYIRPQARTGRPPYPYRPFMRSMLGKSFFGMDKTGSFIERLKSDPNLRLLCGFDTVPDESTFSRVFTYLAEGGIWSPALDALVHKAHEGKVVYHVNRDSTMIPAREKAAAKADKNVKKPKKKRGRPPKNTVKPPKEPEGLEKQAL
jgi:transposase